MSLREMIEQVRGLPPLAVDVGIALACYGAAIANAVDRDRIGWWVVLFATVASLPLIWRRQFPILVTAVAGLGTLALALADATGQVPYGQLVATYTFASLSTGWWRLSGILGTTCGVGASLVIPQEGVAVSTVVAAAFVTAYALGTTSRARRDRIALLEERARRLAESGAAAAARERERIARDMHDILAHSISLVVVQAEAGPLVVRADPARAEKAFDNIATAGREALEQLRRTLGVLRGNEGARAPQPDLGQLGALAEQGRQAGLEVGLEQHGRVRPVAAEVEVAGYRMVQESITNTIKHARASRVCIRLDWDADVLRLAVTDNGGGSRGGDGGHGLIGMRERITACGGQLSTGPGPDGTGFRVAATLPVGGVDA